MSRPDLTIPPPARLSRRPRDPRGYLVPWFVEPQPDGTIDFRVVSTFRRATAVRESLCWVCGGKLGRFRSFVIGPMCAVNRTTSEPACHRDCATWAARVCPFLTRPRMRRRDEGLPEDASSAGGLTIARNPGVAIVWTTTSFETFSTRAADGPGIADGWLITIGPAEHVAAYAESRRATTDELRESIASGIPFLVDAASIQGPDAVAALRGQLSVALEDLERRGLLNEGGVAWADAIVDETLVAIGSGART